MKQNLHLLIAALLFTSSAFAALTVSVTTTNTTCFGQGNGIAKAIAAGGTQPYTFIWRDSFGFYLGNGDSIQDLIPGNYRVTVTDTAGASDSTTFTISEPPILLLSDHVTDVICSGDSTGCIDLTVTGGVFPYQYMWTGGLTTQDICNVPEGFYQVSVKDSNGCIVQGYFDIHEPTQLICLLTYVNPSSFSNTNGAIHVLGSGGVSPYQFSIDSGLTYSFSGNFYSLGVGCYHILIKDNGGCIKGGCNACLTAPSVINETDNSTVRVYPNPASDCLVIKKDNNTVAELWITNGLGETVFKKDISEAETRLNIEWLTAGMYLLNLKTGTRFLKKLVSVCR